ncbi:7SK snRNA methylphosphate capping enzyme [Trichomycterus rosablanca]|uniref:7SK snRNA methylphosphate capping enzyme n=1 Tax=Trichomycterus rosablanca TaxID=2290929 RepID=UPI002F356555
MIEMFADKASVLLSDPSAGASSPRQHSQLSGTRAENLHHPPDTLREHGTEEEPNPMKPDPSGDEVAPSDVPSQSQNGLQPPKPHQQRLNKRRSTMSSTVKSPVFGKRRRRTNSESESVLPTNFLMGGNIFDPLNLNSLLDEEVNRVLNAETPKSSPLPSKSRDPVEILIPRDITDPLNLNGCTAGDAGIVLTPVKSGRRRHRNRHHGGAGGRGGIGRGTGNVDVPGASKGCEPTPIQLYQSESESVRLCLASQPESTLTLMNTQRVDNEGDLDPGAPVEEEPEPKVLPRQEVREEKDSTTVSSTQSAPTHRQRKRRRSNSRSENTGAPCWDKNKTTDLGSGSGSGQHHHPNNRGQPKNSQKPNNQKKKFQYGNYNQYYGYRNPGASEDSRIRVLQPDWFRGKEVLDLGCNTGHLTLTIAKNWRPTRIVGLDIDGSLIHAARQNIRHYLSEIHTLQTRGEKRDGRERNEGDAGEPRKPEHDGKTPEAEEREAPEGKRGGAEGEGSASSNGSCLFPVSMLISRGPIAAPPLPDTPTRPPGNFPSNVTFVKGNYVLDSDVLLQTQREEFDMILCLSVTKWVHLNWGDAGLKRFFRRVYLHLRPGGLFILEPQPWSSYSKRKTLTDTIHKNYSNIQLKPEQFSSFLTGEVGFSSYELLGTSSSSSRGFQRPIYLFHKGAAPRK